MLWQVRLNSGDQNCRIESESVSDLDDRFESDALLSALYPAKICEVDPAVRGCSLQTPPTVLSDASETGTELCCWS